MEINHMKSRKYLLSILIIFLFGCSNNQRDVPKELFDIELGKIYNIGDGTKNSIGDLPIKKITGYESSLTIGQHIYFQPLSANKTLEYKELKNSQADEHFKTTYRLYLLPVLPKSIDSMEELGAFKFDKGEVAVIAWADKLKDEKEAYYWAKDMCETFVADIGKTTKVIENHDLSLYSCIFEKENRVFTIHNIGSLAIFELKYGKDKLQGKIDEIENKLKKLKAKEIIK